MRASRLAISVFALSVAVGASVAAAASPLYDLSASSTSQAIDYNPQAPAAAPASAPADDSSLPLGVAEQVSVTQTPSVPKPGEQVTIRVDSYSTDLNRAAIVWKQDGQVVAEGRGVVEYSFVAPASGKTTTVSFRALEDGGGSLSRTFTVAPADVDILYEAQTYTPPFYRGKALFTNSSQIRFVAVPNVVVNGARVAPDKLTYTWRQDGQVVQSASGYGRQSFTTRGALVVNGIDVEVDVQAVGSDAEATARTSVNYESPKMLLYRKDPLLGILYEQAWSDRSTPLPATEITLAAVPYFIDGGSAADPKLKYSWFVNGEQSSQTGPLAVFRKEGGGVATIEAILKHAVNFAQYADSSATIDLGAAAAGSATSTTL